MSLALGLALVLALAAGPAGPAASQDPAPPAVDLPPATSRLAVFGDYGVANAAAAGVADLVHAQRPRAVVTTGDNLYGGLTYEQAVGQFYGDYFGGRFFPSLGNHDYSDGPGLAGYLSYFDLPGNERYYDVVVGPVHVFVINSNPQEPDGVSTSSTQGQWLQTGLAASTAPWQVVVLHHAPYSSSTAHGSSGWMQWPYAAWGADLVLAGHDHTYERILRGDLTYVVSGLGGNAHYSFPTSGFVAGSQVRFADSPGSLFVDSCADRVRGTFRTSVGTVIDQFTAATAPPPALGPPHAFPDVPAWVDEAVRWLTDPEHRYLTGYPDGTFRPDATVTRGSAVMLLYRLAGSPAVTPSASPPFPDVPDRLTDAVGWAEQEGIVSGYSDGTFRPRDPVTRGAMVRMLYRFVGRPSVAALPQAPFVDVPSWLATSFRWAADPCPRTPTITGYADGTARPGAILRRAEWARLVFRAVT